MASLDSMQRSRIAAARILAESFRDNRDAEDLGDILVEEYMSTGKGDEYDIASTIIDSLADVAFASARRGEDISAIGKEVRSGQPASEVAELMLAFKDAYREDKRGYEATMSFDDLLRIAFDHNGVEIENGDAPDYDAPSLR